MPTSHKADNKDSALTFAGEVISRWISAGSPPLFIGSLGRGGAGGFDSFALVLLYLLITEKGVLPEQMAHYRCFAIETFGILHCIWGVLTACLVQVDLNAPLSSSSLDIFYSNADIVHKLMTPFVRVMSGSAIKARHMCEKSCHA